MKTSPIRIIINGAQGKMGKLAASTLREHTEFEIVAETSRHDHLAEIIQQKKATVVLDLTNAGAVFENTNTILDAGAHPVIGTSGLLKPQIETLQQKSLALKRGGIIVPNFSIGAVLMMKYAQEIIHYFPNVEIIEMHHGQKKDSPSGTAIRTAELLASARKELPDTSFSVETLKGARGAVYQDIPIHSIRLPGLIAHQQIIFGGMGETLTLQHDTIDRQCFMPGVVLACQKVSELKSLVCGLEKIL